MSSKKSGGESLSILGLEYYLQYTFVKIILIFDLKDQQFKINGTVNRIGAAH